MNEETNTPEPLAAILEPKCDWSIKDALALANTLANHGLRDGNADAASSCIYSLCRTLRGNDAAMRAALEDVLEKIDAWRTDGTMEHWQYSQLFDTCDAALAAPARNCDRFANENEAYAAFADAGYSFGSDTLERMYKYCRWLFAPAEGGAE